MFLIWSGIWTEQRNPKNIYLNLICSPKNKLPNKLPLTRRENNGKEISNQTKMIFKAVITLLKLGNLIPKHRAKMQQEIVITLNKPSTHTTLFWHPCDVALTLWTLYGHQNDVVFLLGSYEIIFFFFSFFFLFFFETFTY